MRVPASWGSVSAAWPSASVDLAVSEIAGFGALSSRGLEFLS